MLNLFDIDRFKEIADTLSRNRGRTLLTGFGVFWGIFMLLLMQGGGKGLSQILRDNFDGFATNSVMVAASRTTKPYKGFQRGRSWNIHTEDIRYLRSAVPEADIISPFVAFWGRDAIYGDHSYNVVIKGVTADYAHIDVPQMRYGRYISEMDEIQRRKVCVIGKRVYQTLFPEGGNPCGKFLRIAGAYYEIVGVDVSTSNISINGSADRSVIMPIGLVQMMYHTGDEIDVIAMTASPGVESTVLQEKARQALYRKYHIAPDDRQAMVTVNAEKLFSIVDSLYSGLNILVWLVGLGTLLAGAIGVSNIMMVTVRERTVEIGIRRAIGATPNMILSQIMSESMILTILAGGLGIMFSVMILSVADMIMQAAEMSAQFQVGFGTAVLALMLLMALGLIAGLAPAVRAMAIRPVDAMRDE